MTECEMLPERRHTGADDRDAPHAAPHDRWTVRATRRRLIRLERIPVVGHTGSHRDPAQREPSAVADLHGARFDTGDLDERADADIVEFDDAPMSRGCAGPAPGCGR